MSAHRREPRLRDDVRARTLAKIARDPAPTMEAHRRAAWVRAAIATLVVVALFMAFGGAKPGERDAAAIYGTAIGWLAFGFAAAWGAVARGRSMLGRPRSLLLAIALGLAPVLALWVAAWGGLSLDTPDPGLRAHAVCFGMALLFALAPLALVVWLRRGGDPIHPRVTGAAIFGVAGAVGATMIDLHCPATYAGHVLLGHVLPIAVLALLGALLGSRLLGPSTRDLVDE